jgi:hypothetical protein
VKKEGQTMGNFDKEKAKLIVELYQLFKAATPEQKEATIKLVEEMQLTTLAAVLRKIAAEE